MKNLSSTSNFHHVCMHTCSMHTCSIDLYKDVEHKTYIAASSTNTTDSEGQHSHQDFSVFFKPAMQIRP